MEVLVDPQWLGEAGIQQRDEASKDDQTDVCESGP